MSAKIPKECWDDTWCGLCSRRCVLLREANSMPRKLKKSQPRGFLRVPYILHWVNASSVMTIAVYNIHTELSRSWDVTTWRHPKGHMGKLRFRKRNELAYSHVAFRVKAQTFTQGSLTSCSLHFIPRSVTLDDSFHSKHENI